MNYDKLPTHFLLKKQEQTTDQAIRTMDLMTNGDFRLSTQSILNRGDKEEIKDWCDMLKVSGILEEATTLQVCRAMSWITSFTSPVTTATVLAHLFGTSSLEETLEFLPPVLIHLSETWSERKIILILYVFLKAEDEKFIREFLDQYLQNGFKQEINCRIIRALVRRLNLSCYTELVLFNSTPKDYYVEYFGTLDFCETTELDYEYK